MPPYKLVLDVQIGVKYIDPVPPARGVTYRPNAGHSFARYKLIWCAVP